MNIESEACIRYFFYQHFNHTERDYNYLWHVSSVPMHEHVDFYEIFFLTNGSCRHIYHGKESILFKNTIFIFKPGERHMLVTEPFKSFHFSFCTTAGFFEETINKLYGGKDIFQGENFLQSDVSESQADYLLFLADSLYKNNSHKQVASLFLQNTVLLLTLHNANKVARPLHPYITDLIAKLDNFTYLNYTVGEIYKQYPIACSTLIKLFKMKTGYTIIQYQIRQKMLYASRLLIQSEYNITEIANFLNFESLSHFLKIFKQYYGKTPKEYRKLYK